MERINARKVDEKILQYLRNRGIELRESGMSNVKVAQTLNLAKETTSRWHNVCKKEGKAALEVKNTGCPKGGKKVLSDEQEKYIIRLIIDKNPKVLKFKFALCIRESVKKP